MHYIKTQKLMNVCKGSISVTEGVWVPMGLYSAQCHPRPCAEGTLQRLGWAELCRLSVISCLTAVISQTV